MANLMDTGSISIKEYENALLQLAERRESHLFYNEGNQHALVVFKTIFKNAKRKIYIVAKDLTNNEVSNHPDYLESLSGFLSHNDTQLNIILSSFQRDIARTKPVFECIYNSNAYKNGNVRIFNLNNKAFKDGDNIVHFCFADDQMYRIETDTVGRKAKCNFNDFTVARNLLNNFINGENLPTTTKIDLSKIFD